MDIILIILVSMFADFRVGRCKWFNVAKGWGFITPIDGSPDVFVHQVFSSFLIHKYFDTNQERVKVIGPNIIFGCLYLLLLS